MNIDALVAAAKEIDRKAALSEERARRFGELARSARTVVPGSPEHQRIVNESRALSTTIVDFGDAIDALRKALRGRSESTRTARLKR